MSKSTKITVKTVITEVLFGLVVLLISLLALTFFWVMDTWKSISFGEIVLQLSSPIQGTNSGIINMFYLRCLLPAVIIAIALTTAGILIKRRGIRVALLHLMSIYLSLVMLVVSIVFFDRQFGALDYYQNINVVSDFIEYNYVDPAAVEMAFPKTKRNLIYIYLESMEVTYADTDNGGYMDDNCIPELTQMAEEGDCFSGSSDTLNGAYPLFGTQYTMGGMLAQSSGLPMFGNLGNAAEYQDEFYPGATTLGDILAANGYEQELMVGSDAVFGGRAKYFEQHGGYEIFDIYTARERGLIPEDYCVWWGFEDEKLFEFAKAEILNLADSGEPFNFTMLTADTHFPDGYVCDKCGSEFDTQYENVMACSSKQVYEFVEWIKEQDFYENTTIVISGDHLTMDSNFSNSVSADYDRRTYVAIINPAAEDDLRAERVYSTLDLFPTTLAALGVDFDSGRLALGTNLYSDTKTLLEDYDITYVNRELAKDSPFVEENIATWDKYSQESLEFNGFISVKAKQVFGEEDYLLVRVAGLELLGDTDKKLYAVLETPEGIVLDKVLMDRGTDLCFSAGLDAGLFETGTPAVLKIDIADDNGEYHTFYEQSVTWYSYHETLNINDYLDWAASLEDVSVLIATQDEATYNLSGPTIGKFRHLFGLTFDLYMRGSYCAVIEDGEVMYELSASDSAVSYSGTLANGSEYGITSAGFDYGCMCSIVIDGIEYAPNTRGINFVIYDNRSGEVIDSRVYDTYMTDCLEEDKDPLELDDALIEYDPDTDTLDVSVVIDAEQDYSNTLLFLWDEDTLDSPVKVDMEDEVTDEGRSIHASVDISGLDADTLYISIFVKNNFLIGRYRTKVFE